MNVDDITAKIFRLFTSDDPSPTDEESCRVLFSLDDEISSRTILGLQGRITGSYGPPDHSRECSYFLSNIIRRILETPATSRRQTLICACTLQLLHGRSHNAVESTRRALSEPGAVEISILVELERRLGDDYSVVFVLSLLGASADHAAIPSLHARLTCSLDAVRLAAVEALGTFHLPTVFESLLPLCRDDNEQIRYATIESLFKIDPARASLESSTLGDDPSAMVQLRLIQLLGIAKAENTIPLLITKLATSSEWKIRLHAAKAIGRIRSAHALTSLLDAREDPRPEVRGMVAWALGELGDPAALSALTTMISDQDVLVSWSAENAAGHLRELMSDG